MIEILRLGTVAYEEMLAFQRAELPKLIRGEIPERVIACEHPPTLTVGTSFKEGSLRLPRETIEKKGMTIFEVERGGDVTYHGPGQVILYPMLDLRMRKTDIGWYMRALEESVIVTLAAYGLTGSRSCKNPGVWLGEKKIASCGVKLSRWCTMHGIALNVSAQSLEGFATIIPCGLSDVSMTSIEDSISVAPEYETVKNKLILNCLDALNLAIKKH